VKVADNVTAVPALSYCCHSVTGVNSGGGEIEPCGSAAPLVDESPTANDIFAASMAELIALRCPSATGITKTASSRSR
jgi:hypothetical protein